MALTAVIEESTRCPHLKGSCSFPGQRMQNAALCLPWGRGERSWSKMHIPNSYVSSSEIATNLQVSIRYKSLFTRCRVGARVQSQQGLSQREVCGIPHKIMFPDSKTCERSFSRPLHFSNQGPLEIIKF